MAEPCKKIIRRFPFIDGIISHHPKMWKVARLGHALQVFRVESKIMIYCFFYRLYAHLHLHPVPAI